MKCCHHSIYRNTAVHSSSIESPSMCSTVLQKFGCVFSVLCGLKFTYLILHIWQFIMSSATTQILNTDVFVRSFRKIAESDS